MILSVSLSLPPSLPPPLPCLPPGAHPGVNVQCPNYPLPPFLLPHPVVHVQFLNYPLSCPPSVRVQCPATPSSLHPSRPPRCVQCPNYNLCADCEERTAALQGQGDVAVPAPVAAGPRPMHDPLTHILMKLRRPYNEYGPNYLVNDCSSLVHAGVCCSMCKRDVVGLRYSCQVCGPVGRRVGLLPPIPLLLCLCCPPPPSPPVVWVWEPYLTSSRSRVSSPIITALRFNPYPRVLNHKP